MLSGGTTGTPKLIARTHQDYGYNARAAAAACGLTADSVYLAALPAAFNFTMCCPGILGTLTAGGTVVMAPSPAPETAFPLIAREGVTVTALSPRWCPCGWRPTPTGLRARPSSRASRSCRWGERGWPTTWRAASAPPWGAASSRCSAWPRA
ncbi:AMP-binding protein [Nocardiopsis sp. ARC36]